MFFKHFSELFCRYINIKHGDSKATLYAHMVSPASVKVGQSVKKGQIIGKIGNTGLSYGAHLHFTILDNYDKKPNIYYQGDLLDPVKVCGLGTLKFGSGVKNIVVENGVSKNIGDLNKYYGVSGVTSAPVTPAVTTNSAYKVGDIVNFTGNKHYASSSAVNEITAKSGKAKITSIAKGKAHPYHLVNDGSGSTVCGWVNAADVQSVAKKTIEEIAVEVIRGDWGNGDERIKKLTAAGYDCSAVQKCVNQILNK